MSVDYGAPSERPAGGQAGGCRAGWIRLLLRLEAELGPHVRLRGDVLAMLAHVPFGARVLALLAPDIDTRARQVADEADDGKRQAQADRPGAPPEATLVGRHRHPVREGGTERPGTDVGEPEREDPVQPEPPPGQRGDGDQTGEE